MATAKQKGTETGDQDLVGQLRAANQSLVEANIRARQQAEELEAARRSEQRRAAELQAVLDNMVDGVYVCDAEGKITLANNSGIRMLGLMDVEAVSQRFSRFPELLQLRHPGGEPMTAEDMPLARGLAGETVVAEDLVLRNSREGRDRHIRASAAPLKDDAGRIVGAVVVGRDVTEVMELEHLKDEFIATAAHELKTPVAVMKGYAQMLLRKAGEITSDRARMLEAIDRGADRIDRIVKDLIDISRLHLGELPLANDKIDLGEMARQVAEQVSQMTTKHKIRVSARQPVVVRGDRERMEQVLLSLLDNAVKYSPSGGNVDLEVATRDDEAIVSVRDRGVGIPKDRQARVFERFYRAHAGTPHDYGGMGVGLYISREVVKRHGGRMWFESEDGKGSTFHFSLPLGRGRARR